MTSTNNNILRIAEDVVLGARRNDYGTPLQNHTRTGDAWTWFLRKKLQPGQEVTAEDVCFMNILQKMSRMMTTDKITDDGLVDIAGYAFNIQLVGNDRRDNGRT